MLTRLLSWSKIVKCANVIKVWPLTLTLIDNFTLNIDDIKEFWSFGLCCPLLAFLVFVALDKSFKQKLAFFDKKQAPVSNNQMSKPISEWDWAFQFIVIPKDQCLEFSKNILRISSFERLSFFELAILDLKKKNLLHPNENHSIFIG